jgi:trehalose synthase-fused probable maltokinase
MLETIAGTRRTSGATGSLVGRRTDAFERLWDPAVLDAPPVVLEGQHNNTLISFGDRLVLKLFRRVTPGGNPDFEIGKRLTEGSKLAHVPQVLGAIEQRSRAGESITLAVLHELVANVGDAWKYTLDELGRYLERARSRKPNQVAAASPPHRVTSSLAADAVARAAQRMPAEGDGIDMPRSINELIKAAPSILAQDLVGAYLQSAELLGRRLGELHVALAEVSDEADFRPEPFSRLYQRGLYQSMRAQTIATADVLRTALPRLDAETSRQATQVLDWQPRVLRRFAHLLDERIDAQRIRCHGDFHLGQVLVTGKDFVIIDFEGEPKRPVSERRIKASPLRDVAGMLRSFHYAAHAALRGQTPTLLVQHEAGSNRTWAAFWFAWTSSFFLRAYLAAAHSGAFLPREDGQLQTLLTAFLLEKSLYELRQELAERPDWVGIPLEGILQLVEDS